MIGICPALDDRKSHGQQLAEAKLVQAGCVGHSLQLREVKPRKPHRTGSVHDRTAPAIAGIYSFAQNRHIFDPAPQHCLWDLGC